MKKTIYLYRDVVVGEYNVFGIFQSDREAIRAFNKANEAPEVFSDDLELYRSVALDTKTGKMSSIDDTTGQDAYESPVFICKGEKNAV